MGQYDDDLKFSGTNFNLAEDAGIEVISDGSSFSFDVEPRNKITVLCYSGQVEVVAMKEGEEQGVPVPLRGADQRPDNRPEDYERQYTGRTAIPDQIKVTTVVPEDGGTSAEIKYIREYLN